MAYDCPYIRKLWTLSQIDTARRISLVNVIPIYSAYLDPY